jgi:putative heme-binding domain-containing protein
MFTDASPDVRLQLAIAAGKLAEVGSVEILVDVLSRSGGDPLIPQIVWNNLRPQLDEHERAVAVVFGRYATVPLGVANIAPRLIDYWLSSQEPDARPVLSALDLLLNRRRSPEAAAGCLDRIAERLQNGTLREPVADALRGKLMPFLSRELSAAAPAPLFASAACLAASWREPAGLTAAMELVSESDRPSGLRVRALAALVAAEHDPVLLVVGDMLVDNDQPREFQRDLAFTLAEWNDDRVGELLLATYPRLDPAVQPAAVVALTERPAWARRLLAAIEQKSLPREVLNENHVRRLLRSSDKELAAAVRATWGSLRTDRSPDREQAIRTVREIVARTEGDPHAGVKVFQKACAQCHKIYEQGEDVGPELTRNGRNSWDQLLSNVFDPSLVIGAGYQPRIVITADGRSFTGLVVEDSEEIVTLKLQGGKTEVISRGDIEQMETVELSLMPDGVERQLSEQELADLLAFLALDGPPEDPEARLLDGAPAARK